jgi:hypothetical protein
MLLDAPSFLSHATILGQSRPFPNHPAVNV